MGIIENVKELADLVKKAGDIELYRKLVDLQVEVMNLTHDNHELKEKLLQSERKLQEKAQLKFKAPFYRMEGDETPYCAVCWEKQKLAIHVVFSHRNPREERWDCPSCDKMYLMRPDDDEGPAIAIIPDSWNR